MKTERKTFWRSELIFGLMVMAVLLLTWIYGDTLFHMLGAATAGR